MKARTKFLIFLIAAAVFSLVVLFLLIRFENNNLIQLQKQAQFEQEKIVKKLVLVVAQTQKTFANDYSLWNDMVRFTESENVQWANDNIPAGLKTYSSDFAWVYNQKFSLIYETASSEGIKSLVKEPLPSETLKQVFSAGRNFCHFFTSTPAGIVEIHGAVIVYEKDEERKDPPYGYLLIGRLWNTKFLENLSEISDSRMTFSNKQPAEKVPGNNVAFVLDLKSWDGEIVSRILVEKEAAGVKAFSRATKDILRLVVFLFVALLIALLLFFRKWIVKPLNCISNTLETENSLHLKEIAKTRDEFCQIGQLISQFIEQKKHLALEIKQRKKIAEQLQREKDKAQNYLAVASVIIVTLNTKGEVTLINQKGCELLGRQENEILQNNWFDNFTAVSMRSESRSLFEQMLSGAQEVVPYSESAIVGKDGKERVIAWHHVYLRDSNNEIFEILSSGEDISDRKEIEKAQRFAQLGMFVSRMAHEVNNPLMIISGRAQLSLMESPVNPEVKNNLETIMSECQRAKDIIMRLLKFSKPGKKEPESADVNKLAEESIVLLEHQFKLNNINIIRDYGNALPLVKINTKELQEVIMNLLINAEDAITGEGNIIVRTYQQDEWVKIDIQDTGKGMSSEVLEKAFDPFFTTKDKGTGLGLAVSYSIMQANKGAISLKSIVSKGTTVTIQLPLQSP